MIHDLFDRMWPLLAPITVAEKSASGNGARISSVSTRSKKRLGFLTTQSRCNRRDCICHPFVLIIDVESIAGGASY